MPYDITRQALIQETEGVLGAITHPRFLEGMQRFREEIGQERIKFAEEQLVPEVLLSQGVPLPEKMRVSSRVFEEGGPISAEFVDYQEGKRILALIEEKRPELLEELRINNPKIWEDLQEIDEPSQLASGPSDSDVIAAGACGCACGGAVTVCGGAGGGGGSKMVM